MPANTDFGDIIAADFAKCKKGEEFVIGIRSSTGETLVLKVLAADADSVKAQVKNRGNDSFSVDIETFNPDQFVSYKRVI